MSVPNTTWTDQAECRDTAIDHWFSPSGKKEGHQQRAARIRQAKTICATCPVRFPCYEAGLTEPHGIWGGHDRSTYRTD